MAESVSRPQTGPKFGIVIPARFASARFPGKPLALLAGATGEARPLIRRAWEAAMAVPGTAGVWVATDDPRIAEAVRGFGGAVVMTSASCRNGTERCADALAALPADLDIVVNLQGDAPLTPSFIVTDLVAALAADRGAAMATAGLRCSASTYDHLVADQSQGRVGGTTVVVNRLGHALYFSKRVIPYVPVGLANGHEAVRLHLGLYAYRPAALRAYAAAPPSPLEDLEGLEQLRFLEGEAPVRVVSFDPVGWDCIELNNPEDVPAIEAVLRARGIA
ncbi:MAG: 3-deoxy-manno-octulosonate cytidylyltransferase [Sphingomonadales bacterium]|nr:3-deoxy-manno-octulosonate cytidylyltransferase [Sphingomonadales bacterium]